MVDASDIPPAAFRQISRRLGVTYELIAEFCAKHGIVQLEAFGSILRDDFGPESDIDLIATFAPDRTPTRFARLDMRDELASTIGRRIDLLPAEVLERGSNGGTSDEIRKARRVIYCRRT